LEKINGTLLCFVATVLQHSLKAWSTGAYMKIRDFKRENNLREYMFRKNVKRTEANEMKLTQNVKISRCISASTFDLDITSGGNAKGNSL